MDQDTTIGTETGPKDPEKDVAVETDVNQGDYPPTKKVLPAMFAIYLVFFLVALVGIAS